MVIVDTHCHVSQLWYEPVESLLFQMERHSIGCAVLIQMMGEYDNTYLLDCARRFPGRFAPVVLVDTDRLDACDTLCRLVDAGASGVRLRPTSRSPGNDQLAIWRCAAELRLPVSCLGTVQEFASEDFAGIVNQFRELPLVVEHLGGVGTLRTRDENDWAAAERVFALARFTNCYVKVTGLGEIRRRAQPVTRPDPFQPDAPPWLARALTAWGADRVMWGSDYPPVSSREGYGNALRWTVRALEHLGMSEPATTLGANALRVFAIVT
ncbi:MAG: amidohydrolase [Chloroflexi bacterium]|nr:amidohydrolase [Chloroflexota bacterium]